MDKAKQFFKKIWARMNDPRYEKPLLAAICVLAVLLSVLILIPAVKENKAARAAEEERVAAMARAAEEAQFLRTLHVEAVDQSLRIRIEEKDEEEYRLSLNCPNGKSYQFSTEGGELFFRDLPSGTYTIDFAEESIYHAAEPVRCQVGGDQTAEVQIEGSPVLDETGNPCYHYEALLGPHGYLLSNETMTESNVLPIDRDGDGDLDYGICVVPSSDAEEKYENETVVSLGGSYPVTLLHKDNSPVEDYAITAVPIVTDGARTRGWQLRDGNFYYYDSNGNRLTGMQRIDGKYYFFDATGACAAGVGIDVSFYNEHINWEKVKAQGIDFAIARIGGRGWSSGLPYGDVRFREYLLGAKQAGIKFGVYFYTTAVDAHEAVEEARIVVDSLKGIPLEYPIFLDMEFSGEYPYGRADRLMKAKRMEIVDAFCRTVQAAGYKAGIYSSEYFLGHELNHASLEKYTVWLANYTQYGAMPSPAKRYDLWQFTDRGRVAGINGGVDMNIAFRER